MILKNTHALNVYGKELNVEGMENIIKILQPIFKKAHYPINKYTIFLDPILLAEILTQAPYSLSSFLTTEKGERLKEHMIQQAREHFDRITATLRTMPKAMMLIIR